jgi:uncharacterized protein YciI
MHPTAYDRQRGTVALPCPAAPADRPEDAVSAWISFLHPPREDFAATMTPQEEAVWDGHFERLQELLAKGVLVLAGPTLGRINTGIAVFEAPDEEAARRIMEEDPVIAGGFARGELRPFRVSLLRGRD